MSGKVCVKFLHRLLKIVIHVICLFVSASARRCKVLFSYEPANDDELELKVDDIIEILTEVEEGWWRGKLRSKVRITRLPF